ncbi:MAG: RidA family protein [Myxococcota bacterium]|nr:RidA family protein [Myxococcota bacterium]
MKSVCSEDAPAPVGPYSQAVVRDGLVFVSGQIPLDPATGHLVTGDIETQVRRVLENLHAVLRAAGSELGRVLRTTIYLTDLDDFQRVNAVYAEFFADEPQPARSTVQVAALPLGARVEVDCIAHV